MDPVLLCLLVAAVVTRTPAALADAWAAKKAADAGEWEFLRDREARRDARAARRADWAERILARRRSKAEGEDPKRAGLGTLLGDIYHGACEDALERRRARRANRPEVADSTPQADRKPSLGDRVTGKLRELVEKHRAKRPAPVDTNVDPETKPVGDDIVDSWRDELDDEGLKHLQQRRCVWATGGGDSGSGYCGQPVTGDDVVYCDPHCEEWDRVYGRHHPTTDSHGKSVRDDPGPSAGHRPETLGPYQPGEAHVDPQLAYQFLDMCPGCGEATDEHERRVDGGVETYDRCGYLLHFTPDQPIRRNQISQTTEGEPMTTTDVGAAGTATIEDVQTNEAARRAFDQMAEGAAQLAEAATLAEQARAKIAAAALAAGDGMASVAFDAAATQSVADINDTVHDGTLHRWSETADQIQAAAQSGKDALEKYRPAEEIVAANNVDARTVGAEAS